MNSQTHPIIHDLYLVQDIVKNIKEKRNIYKFCPYNKFTSPALTTGFLKAPLVTKKHSFCFYDANETKNKSHCWIIITRIRSATLSSLVSTLNLAHRLEILRIQNFAYTKFNTCLAKSSRFKMLKPQCQDLLHA